MSQTDNPKNPFVTKDLEKKAFTPLKDSQESKDMVKELARRKRVGIEQGQEELERSGSQSQIGSQIVADRRAAAAAGATSGVQGITQANKLLQADVAGMARTATFEGDLASRDFAAQEAAGQQLSEFQVDLTQDEIESSAKELAYRESQSQADQQLVQNFIDNFARVNNRLPTPAEIDANKIDIGGDSITSTVRGTDRQTQSDSGVRYVV